MEPTGCGGNAVYTVFGRAVPSVDQRMAAALTERDGRKIGYESGASLYNRLGLTTWIPREIEITTNDYGMKLPEGCHLKPRKPTTTITDENWRYLRFIDVVAGLYEYHVDTEQPDQLLLRLVRMERLDKLTLIQTACRHYSHQTAQQITNLLAPHPL